MRPRFSAPHLGWLIVAVALMAGTWGSYSLVQLGRWLERHAIDDRMAALEIAGTTILEATQYKCDALLRRAP